MRDLSQVRHDLRTPINHILGYTEMLLEEETLEGTFRGDLEHIRTSGLRLLELINQYLNDRATEQLRSDRAKILHDLRTPVNHIIGYGELLEERAEEEGLDGLMPDLQRIVAASKLWLERMEQHLLHSWDESTASVPEPIESVAGLQSRATPIALSSPRPQREDLAVRGKIVVVDDDAGNRELLSRRLRKDGHEVLEAENAEIGVRLLRQGGVDLILLDRIMPQSDGYTVLKQIKSDPDLRDTLVLMISGLDGQQGIARCIEAGAEDYLLKPFDSVLLRARVRACLEKKQLRDRELRTHLALVESQRRLVSELAEAAEYVRSLLPAPLVSGPIHAEWYFKPSTQLGGDALGYHWLDTDHFAVYLLDVCGHGIGAALLSVSALNMIRSRSLPGVNGLDPISVMQSLNEAFPMELHHEQYFTLWYGVLNIRSGRLRYGSAGHPPAFLIHTPASTTPSPSAEFHELRTAAPPIGCFKDASFSAKEIDIKESGSLWIFSDGAYELPVPNARPMSISDYRNWVLAQSRSSSLRASQCMDFVETRMGDTALEDDLSVLCLRWNRSTD